MTIAAGCQLALTLEHVSPGVVGWEGLPEPARKAVMVLLARLIARGVLTTDIPTQPDKGVGDDAVPDRSRGADVAGPQRQDHRFASGAGRLCVCPPVHPHSGAGSH